MGFQKVQTVENQSEMQRFIHALLNDVHALTYMLENDWFESDIIRIGAEQEMCLVDNSSMKPVCINMKVLEKMTEHPWCVTELAQFNLETNLSPREFTGTCLSDMEAENLQFLSIISQYLEPHHASIILTGILPTLRKHDLDLKNLTPKDRYFALMASLSKHLQGSTFELRLEGIDELLVKHDSPLLEACNTSFQVHLQVSPNDFVKMYNIAQALAGPMIAIAANSPLVFGRRLWHESRIALFRQSLDTRTTADHMRERLPRVNFGSGWLYGDITQIHKEDIGRFRVLLGGAVEEDSLALIREGKVPKLRALQIHNSSVYRWNRPCYGISSNGKPHLRIENRVLPAGPSVVDATANAALWLGTMMALGKNTDDITKKLSFADVRDNFMKASRTGLDSTFTWFGDKKVSASEFILKEMLPMAREGLKNQKVKTADINKYMDIIEERAKSHVTGARWLLRSFTKLTEDLTSDESLTLITSKIIENQQKNMPVHTWELPKSSDSASWRPDKLKVEEFMTTDLFTTQPDDSVELVAEIMNWRKIRYVPVENAKGELVGLVSSRLLLRHFTRVCRFEGDAHVLVRELMVDKPIVVKPETTIFDAMNLMRENKIGCLPVVKGKELVGIITEMDFLRITARLMERMVKD